MRTRSSGRSSTRTWRPRREPSQTDIGLAYYPDSLYIVCSLTDIDDPDLRAWSIVDGDGF